MPVLTLIKFHNSLKSTIYLTIPIFWKYFFHITFNQNQTSIIYSWPRIPHMEYHMWETRYSRYNYRPHEPPEVTLLLQNAFWRISFRIRKALVIINFSFPCYWSVIWIVKAQVRDLGCSNWNPYFTIRATPTKNIRFPSLTVTVKCYSKVYFAEQNMDVFWKAIKCELHTLHS